MPGVHDGVQRIAGGSRWPLVAGLIVQSFVRVQRSLAVCPPQPLTPNVSVATMRVAFEEFPMARPGSCDGWAGRLGLRVVKRRPVLIFPLGLRDCTATMRQGRSLEETIADVPTERRDFMAIWQTLSV